MSGTKTGKIKLNKDLARAFYSDMLLIRRFEEKAGQLYGMGLIGGFCHLYIGQEAVAVGIQHALEERDSVITGYRDHGHMLVKGMDPGRIMAELTGRRSGYSRGKGGSMHMFAPERGFYGGHGIVGAQVPLGTGIAFAHKYRDDGGICVAFLGDGAVNQGQVCESFNMASLWQLPVLFVIENNGFGTGKPTGHATPEPRLCDHGSAYGIQGLQTDGMDVQAVFEQAQIASQYVRKGQPFILEAMTYRYRGHSMSDPAKYRTRQEVQEMRERHDPIENLRGRIIEQELIDDETLKAIDKEVREKVNSATRFAQDDPEPEADELMDDIWVGA